MRKLIPLLMIIPLLALSACKAGEQKQGKQAEKILAYYTALEGYSWSGTLRVDYGDRVLDFGLNCETGKEATRIQVTSPELLRGVAATLKADSAALEYDGFVLETGKLPGTGLSPLEIVPLMQEQFSSGYVVSETAETLRGQTARRVTFSKGDMQIDAWFAPGGGESPYAPLACELSADGVLVARLTVASFRAA